MRYLRETDFRPLITPDELAMISQDSHAWGLAEETAIELASSYLRGRYDTQRTFEAQGAARNPMLVHTVVVLCIWQCIHRLPERMGYDRWEPLHEEAIRWLESIQRGKASPDLPMPQTETDHPATTGAMRFGGMRRNTYDY